MKDADVRLAANEEGVSPVTILDALGRVIRIVPAAEFRRSHGSPTRSAMDSGRHRPGGRLRSSDARPGRIENDVPRRST
jgi:hypothetical protein